jgi:hypothetical protein
MMKKLLIMAFAASAFAACCNNGGAACDARNLDRAKATLDSIYAHYGVAENRLLRENYPFNVDYMASYLASADQARPNPYSYLWPFSGTLSAVNTILEADASYRSVLDGRVLPGLAEYLACPRLTPPISIRLPLRTAFTTTTSGWVSISAISTKPRATKSTSPTPR